MCLGELLGALTLNSVFFKDFGLCSLVKTALYDPKI